MCGDVPATATGLQYYYMHFVFRERPRIRPPSGPSRESLMAECTETTFSCRRSVRRPCSILARSGYHSSNPFASSRTVGKKRECFSFHLARLTVIQHQNLKICRDHSKSQGPDVARFASHRPRTKPKPCPAVCPLCNRVIHSKPFQRHAAFAPNLFSSA